MKKMLYLFFCGGKKSGLVCRVDGPSVSEVNHVVFTDKTGLKKTTAPVKSIITYSYMHTFV